MIRFVRGDLLAAPAEALVNPVNCVGVMGRGLALAFKAAFPENFAAYAAACRAKEVATGRMFVFKRQASPRWIVNFPTKRHFRTPSKLEWIEDGLIDLRRVIVDMKIASIAVPALGCGLGGLDWLVVRPLIVDALDPIEGLEVHLHEPE